MNRENRMGILAAIVGNGIFGFSFMFSRIALSITTPFVLLMYRFILAFVLLTGLAVWSNHRRTAASTGEGDWLRFDLRGKRILPLLLMGVVQPVGYFLCESYGISLTNSTFAGVIIATAPMAALVAGVFVLGEYPSKSQVIFSGISIAGVVIMTLMQRSEGAVKLGGVLLLIGAVVCGTTFNIISRKLSGAFSALERTCVMMFVAAVSFTIMALVQSRGDWQMLLAPLQDMRFLLALLYLGAISSVVAFLALNLANGCLPIAKSMAFCNLTTVISLFAGVVFLHEPFSVVSLFASLLIILGIWGVQRV